MIKPPEFRFERLSGVDPEASSPSAQKSAQAVLRGDGQDRFTVAADPAAPKGVVAPRGLGTLNRIESFGPNPGELEMFEYVPPRLAANAPLIVVLHGCVQGAHDYDDESGWKRIADAKGFPLLLPQQRTANNENACFNWFEVEDIERDKGEARSIKSMVDTMFERHDLDADRVFINGLSAGGAMTGVMLATYPETFAAGAMVDGLPYRSATSLAEAYDAMKGDIAKSREQWAALVRSASSHRGPWPTVSIWQGSDDKIVNPKNASMLAAQWCALHGLNGPGVKTLNGKLERTEWRDVDGELRVQLNQVKDLAHGTPIDTRRQCGVPGLFTIDIGICAAADIAKFFGL